MFTRMG